MAFKEEQECRILSLVHLTNNNSIKPQKEKEDSIIDFSKMYIEYTLLKDFVKTVYFAPKTIGFSIYKDQIRRFGLKIKCVQSKHPFS